jgi:hypothetical protein
MAVEWQAESAKEPRVEDEITLPLRVAARLKKDHKLTGIVNTPSEVESHDA